MTLAEFIIKYGIEKTNKSHLIVRVDTEQFFRDLYPIISPSTLYCLIYDASKFYYWHECRHISIIEDVTQIPGKL